MTQGHPALDRLLHRIAQMHGLAVESLRGKGRGRALTDARWHYAAEARALGIFTLTEIGAPLGQDHSTIGHGIDAWPARAPHVLPRLAALPLEAKLLHVETCTLKSADFGDPCKAFLEYDGGTLAVQCSRDDLDLLQSYGCELRVFTGVAQ